MGGTTQSRFVGRAEELERLHSALDVVAEGSAAALAIVGDAGIGKTRLLEQLAVAADERGHLVLLGSAAEFERDLPFGVLVDALDDPIRALGADKVQRLGAELQAQLGQIFPALADLAGDPGRHLHHERYRAHRAVRELLERLSASHPVVLLLDDLHWADHASIELLAAMLRRPPAAPVLLALALRPRQAPAPLTSMLDHAVRAGLVQRLDLAALSEADARALTAAAIRPSQWAPLYELAGGNPFFLEELAHSMGRRDAAVTAGGRDDASLGDGALPGAVAAALTREQDLLSERARTLLRSAAVVGDPFDADLAAVAAEMGEDAALEALDELLAGAFVHPTDVPGHFRFRHPLLRRSAYDATLSGWRRRAHERLASSLAARGARTTARAHHVARSARPGDLDAIALLVAAGRTAERRAPATAAEWYAAALRLLPDDDVPSPRRIELLSARADALGAIGRLEQSHAVLLELLELLPLEPTVERTSVVRACATVETLLGRHRDARERLRATLASVEDRMSAAAVELEIELAINRYHAADYGQMRQHAQAARAASESLGDRALRATATATAAVSCAHCGDFAASGAYADEAARLVDALPDADAITHLDAFSRLAWGEVFLERYEDSIRHAGRGIALARASGKGLYLPQMVHARSCSQVFRGQLAEAVESETRAVEAAHLAGVAYATVWAQLCCAYALLPRDVTAALQVGKDSATLARDLPLSATCALARAMYSAAASDAGEHELAVAELLEAGAGPSLITITVSWRPFFFEILTRSQLACGRLEAADAAARHAEEIAHDVGLRMPATWARRARAAVLLAEGKPLESAELATSSATIAAAAGAPIEEGRSRALAGRALLQAGERAAAIAAWQSAAAAFESSTAASLRDAVERDLRRVGRPYHRRRGPSGGGAGHLSPRELEVAELVSRRMTNREVAAALFLSEKTVEAHLRNIFAKLGVSSRRELKAALSRLRDG